MNFFDIAFTIAVGALIFCLLIFIHEIGHFAAAKAVGIRVNEFALGMGPKLLRFKKGETEYTLRAVPIGGFCAMEGEDADSEDPRAFGRKNMAQKALVIVAGAAMNLIMAVVILIVAVFVNGVPFNKVAQFTEDSPAAAAGMMAGDEIIGIDGKEVASWEQLVDYVTNAGDTIVFTVLRDGKEMTIDSGSYLDGSGARKVGITPARRMEISNLAPSVRGGVLYTGYMLDQMFGEYKKLFSGQGSIKDLSGPVGIVQMAGQVAQTGLPNLMLFTALISLCLAVANMLPLPALDGGRLVFLVIRKITGKRFTDEMEGRVHLVGIMLLFGLIAVVTFNDFSKIASDVAKMLGLN